MGISDHPVVSSEAFIWQDWDLDLSVDQVLRGQGMDPERARRRPVLVEMATWALSEGLSLLAPVVLGRELVVEGVRHARLSLAGGGRLQGELLAGHLPAAERVVAMLCTIGGQLDEVAAELLRSDPPLGLALGAVGGAAVEELAVQACSRLESLARAAGLNASIPLSPGMVGWPADEGQRQIFDLLDAAQVGVCLTDSLMMVPTKSLTLVVGLGRELSATGRACDYCSIKDVCRYQNHFPAAT